MTTDRTRRIAAASIAAIAATTLAACGTGGDAATSQQYQPGIGANLREGEVQLYNALLVGSADETVAFSAGIVNNTDQIQTLESASFTPLGGGTAVTVEPAVPVTIAPGQLFTVGSLGELSGIEASDIGLGRYATAELTFSGAGAVSLETPVVSRNASYDDVAEAPVEDPATAAATDEAGAEG